VRTGGPRSDIAVPPEVAEMPGGRGWWRLAYDADGQVVGVVLPTRNPGSATIGYLGVVPEHRGHRYADDLVAEALHCFSDAGAVEANDGTDVGNARWPPRSPGAAIGSSGAA
jgi:GNAT superfamily N-acetyltransferase